MALLCVVLLGQAACGAPILPQYGSRLWRMDEGLPHNFVQSVCQTSDGYLWVGTQYGLARFDGVRFTLFNRVNVPEMVNGNVLDVHQSKDGCLWLQTGRGGLLRLKDGQFTHFGKSEGLADDSCLGSSLETSDGAIWFGTLGGLSRYKDGRFTNYGGAKSGLASDVVRTMVEDPEGRLWLATPRGIYCWKDGKVLRHITASDGLRANDARAIWYDADGTIWAGCGNGLSRIQGTTVTTYNMSDTPGNNILTHIYRDKSKNLWIGSYGGLSRFVDGTFISQLDAQGQEFDLVNAIFEDREDNLWIGSRDGLIRLNRHCFTSYTQKQGLTCNNVTSVLEGGDGSMWIGTWGGGVNRLKDGVFSSISNPGSTLVLSLFVDSAQQLWAGTDWGGGLFEFGKEATHHYADNEGMTGGAVRVIYQDRAGNCWLGTTKGLYRCEGKSFRAFGAKHGMREQIIRAITEDDNGDLWLGTNDGLWRLHDGALSQFNPPSGRYTATTGAVFADHHGNLWLGTSGEGVYRLRDGNLTRYSFRQGLFSDNVYEIIADDKGWLWMTSQRGVFRIEPGSFDRLDKRESKALECISYGYPDGLASEMCSMVSKPSAWKDRQGRLWFATAKGLSVTEPELPAEVNPNPPTVVLERVIAGRQPFPGLETLPVTGPIEIPPGHTELEIQYTAMNLRVPERSRFKYRLDGVDNDWVEAGSRRFVHYSNIYPGKYRFHVLARNSGSKWSETGAMADIVVLPHVWETWSFKMALGALIVIGAFCLHLARVARVRQLHNLRLRLAADIHDEVGSNLSTISLLTRKILKDSRIASETSEDVSAISRISGQTSSSIREIVWFINPENDTVEDLILRMKETANAMLPGIECRFESTQENPSRTLRPVFRQDFLLIYKEILANVAKHSQATRVDITVSNHDGAWKLSVHDNGVGFDTNAAYPGNGLKNLRLRAARLKGELLLKSHAGRGTTAAFSTSNT